MMRRRKTIFQPILPVRPRKDTSNSKEEGVSSEADNAKASKQPTPTGRRKRPVMMPNLKCASRSRKSSNVTKPSAAEPQNGEVANKLAKPVSVPISLQTPEPPVLIPPSIEVEASDVTIEPAQENLEVSLCSMTDISSATSSFVAATDLCDQASTTIAESNDNIVQVHTSPTSGSSLQLDDKSPVKSKKQLLKEHFGFEPKVNKQRIALSKLKSMELHKISEENKSEWENLDRNLLSMSDLIYINPPEGSGKELGIRAKLRSLRESRLSAPSSPRPAVETTETDSTTLSSQEQELTSLAPQIRVNEDGSIVLDEESLTIKSPSRPGGVVEDLPAVYESGFNHVNQSSFRRKPIFKAPRWTDKETEKFYKALSIVGIDFGLMSTMFRYRNRDELRRKYRLESKKNSDRIDEALKKQHLIRWTSDMFKPFSSSDDEQNNKSTKSNKRKSKKRKLNTDTTETTTND